ncbi:hypothetical protein C2R67_00250 [Helicobacter pylori]|nr:hypothetical protein [Helicobacter pylori]PUD44617.1 hypothetical protein C2R67_00250 [Helicobacter pylori]
MKGISLIKIEFKGYALEFKKKMILQEMRIKNDPTRNENKERIKNNKNPSQSKLFFIDFFRLRPH